MEADPGVGGRGDEQDGVGNGAGLNCCCELDGSLDKTGPRRRDRAERDNADSDKMRLGRECGWVAVVVVMGRADAELDGGEGGWRVHGGEGGSMASV